MVIVEIRQATPNDANAVAAVSASAVATLRKTYHPNQKALAHKRAAVDLQYRLVALLNRQIVGTVEYHLKSDRIHLMSLDIHFDYRRQGIAKQLITELDRIGKSMGATRLSLFTVVQTGNQRIFERIGFRIISEEPSEFFESDDFNSLTEAYMERSIA